MPEGIGFGGDEYDIGTPTKRPAINCCVGTVDAQINVWFNQLPPIRGLQQWEVNILAKFVGTSECTELPCEGREDMNSNTCAEEVIFFNSQNDPLKGNYTVVSDPAPITSGGRITGSFSARFSQKAILGCCPHPCPTVYWRYPDNDKFYAFEEATHQGPLPTTDAERDFYIKMALGYFWLGGEGPPNGLAGPFNWLLVPKCCPRNSRGEILPDPGAG